MRYKFRLSQFGAGGAPSYLLDEGFEGTGTPAGCTVGGVPNFDYTTVHLVGAQSALFNNGDTAYWSVAAQSSIDIFFMAQFTNVTTANDIFYLYNSVPAVIAGVQMSAGSQPWVLGAGGVGRAGCVATVATGTPYYFWTSYLKGTGANGVVTLAFSTNGIRPLSGNNYCSYSSETGTTDAVYPFLNSTVNGVVIDHVLVKATAGSIGDNP